MSESVVWLRIVGALFYAFVFGVMDMCLPQEPPWHMLTLWLMFKSHWSPWAWSVIGAAIGPGLLEHNLRRWHLWPKEPC